MNQNQNQTTNPAPRDTDEPIVGNVTVPIWIVLAFGVLAYFVTLYVSDHAAGFQPQVYWPFQSTEELAAANPKSDADVFRLMGQDVFNKTCAPCHQPSGQGKDGTAPPLAGSEWVMAPGPNRIAHAVMNGLSGPIDVKGKNWNLAMPPWRDVYDDEHLAAVLTYIRSSWDNKAPAVKPSDLTAVRTEKHPGPMSSQELLSMPMK